MAGYIPINVPQRGPSGPFSADFFKRKFHQFIREACETGESTTVLELVLVSGQVLDVSHFEDFDVDYMLLCVFVDDRSCEDIYHTYIRYDSIFRVNVFEAKTAARPVGFNYHAYSQSLAGQAANGSSSSSKVGESKSEKSSKQSGKGRK